MTRLIFGSRTPLSTTTSSLARYTIPGANNHDFKLYSWNARGLLCQDLPLRAQKAAVVRQLLEKADVLCLQEVHGVAKELQKYYRKEAQNFDIHYDHREGGIAIFIRKSVISNTHTTCSCTPLAAGRAQAITITNTQDCVPCSVSIVNIHNHNITPTQLQVITKFIDEHSNNNDYRNNFSEHRTLENHVTSDTMQHIRTDTSQQNMPGRKPESRKMKNAAKLHLIEMGTALQPQSHSLAQYARHCSHSNIHDE